MPNFLVRRYHFYEGEIASQSCLFAYSLHPEEDTAGQVSQHLSIVQREHPGVVVYAAKSMSATRRSQFVSAGVPFAVPRKQLYLPQLAVDLREVFRATRRRRSEHLSPVAQATLFFSLLFREELALNWNRRTPSRMAKQLGYSSMSVGRGFEELTDFGLAAVETRGRQKFLVFQERPERIVEKSRELLRSPVHSTKLARGHFTIPPMKIAGESALSKLTGLSPPEVPVYAIHAADWKLVSGKEVEEVQTNDEADAVVEVWHYRPDALSRLTNVDPLSLYAQFWDDRNERVAKSAAELLEHMQW